MAWVIWSRIKDEHLRGWMPWCATWHVHRRYAVRKSAEMALAHLSHARSDLWEYALTGGEEPE